MEGACEASWLLHGPDLAGTAHSFVGATLKAALIDCDNWEQEPNHDTQLSGYMCLSRAEEIEGICIVKAYAPSLFRNGDLLGPDLLLKFQRGAINEEELPAAEKKTDAKKVRRPNDWNWINELRLYCRGCSETAGEEVYKAAKEFPGGHSSVWDRVIALGMESSCRTCSNARKAGAGAARPESRVK